MQIASFDAYTVGECGCCKRLLSVRATRGVGVGAIQDKLDRHLFWHRKCRRWYAALPTWADLRGAFPDLRTFDELEEEPRCTTDA